MKTGKPLADEQAIACFLKKANRSFKQLIAEIEQISTELLGSIIQDGITASTQGRDPIAEFRF